MILPLLAPSGALRHVSCRVGLVGGAEHVIEGLVATLEQRCSGFGHLHHLARRAAGDDLVPDAVDLPGECGVEGLARLVQAAAGVVLGWVLAGAAAAAGGQRAMGKWFLAFNPRAVQHVTSMF